MPLRLPAEWEPQRFIQLTWPHAATDWAPYLDEAEECFLQIAQAVTRFEPLVIVTPHPEDVANQLRKGGVDTQRVTLLSCPTQDTWARDHAFLTLHTPTADQPHAFTLADYTFNGWGMKFAAHLDNQINPRVFATETFRALWPREVRYARRHWVLEGGSIESDGTGTLLTTADCLLSLNRNDWPSEQAATEWLIHDFGAHRVLWLHHGYLAGDDTDSHIDTLARLCPDDTIVYTVTNDPTDEHYAALQAMQHELTTFRTLDGRPYRLLALPLPAPIFDTDDDTPQRLPATYANFLILNGAVLYPTYQQPALDAQAASVLALAFPNREIIGIDCRILIRQHGSLHCVTMQYPA